MINRNKDKIAKQGNLFYINYWDIQKTKTREYGEIGLLDGILNETVFKIAKKYNNNEIQIHIAIVGGYNRFFLINGCLIELYISDISRSAKYRYKPVIEFKSESKDSLERLLKEFELPTNQEDIKDKPILEFIELSIKTRKDLENACIKTLNDILKYNKDDLLKLGFGKKSIRELEYEISEFGLNLQED